MAADATPRLLESANMIDREQVLHVARLARLELTEDEVGRMSEELSAVLGHIEKIGELDLDGVPPTTHVVEVSNALRPDVVEPSLPREVALASAPAVADGGFLVPSPQADADPPVTSSEGQSVR
jgi:aspartyl-tRNA(Asn)/glutamyl-tRNA(Gln) amidotransferase subunit C